MQVTIGDKDDRKYEVVDGQRRIRAIFKFIDGEYAILDDEQTAEFRGKEFTDLSGGDKQNIWNYSPVTRELTSNIESEIKGVFIRINKNVVPFMPQELRRGTYAGHFITIVERLAEDSFWADNRIVTPNDIKRMKNSEFISELMVVIMCGPQEGTKELDKLCQMCDTDLREGHMG